MEELRNFRKVNHLTQDQLGEFLGIKKSFISRVENGQVSLPEDKFNKLLKNAMGWDISMLKDIGKDVPVPSAPGKHVVDLFEGPRANRAASNRSFMVHYIEYLEKRIDELERQNEEYWEMIKKLTEK